MTKKEHELEEEIKEYQKALDETTSEKIDLDNIIKEVREKIENTTINCEGVAEDLLDDSYAILDKGE